MSLETLLTFLERPAATGAFAVEASGQSHECRWLWKRHDGPECQGVAMSVVTISDAADGVAEDLD